MLTIMMRLPQTKKKVIYWSLAGLLLLLALMLRLNFVLRCHQLPVVWDAAGYNIQAKEFAKSFQSWPDRQLFDKHFRKAYEMALPKSELYPLFLSGIYFLHGIDFQSARVTQAFLGTISCLLLYLIAAKVFNRRIAIFSLLLSSFYIPFILSEGRLLTETLAIFVLLLTNLLLILSLEKGEMKWIFLSGLASAFLILSRNFFQYIFIIYWPLLVVGLAIKKVRWFFPKSFLFLFGFSLIIVPRLFWTPQIDRTHRHLISGSMRNGMAIYCGICLSNHGFLTDASPNDEIFKEVARNNRHLSMDDIYYKAYFTTFFNNPVKAFANLLAKGWIFWQRAYNDFLQSYLLSPKGINIFNQIILVLGLFGLCTLFGLGPRSWPILASLLYIWMLCFLTDVVGRFTLPAMPLMIVAGIRFGEKALQGLIGLRRQSKRVKLYFWICILFCCFLFLLSAFIRPAFMMTVIAELPFMIAYYLWVIFTSLALLSIIPILFILYLGKFQGWRRIIASVLPPIFILLVYLSALEVHPTWHQWKIRLQEQGQKVSQKIYLPDDLQNYRSAELKIDMISGPDRHYDLTIKVDGELVRRFERGLTGDPASYVAKRRAFPIYLREEKRKLSEIKQWFTIPLDITKLKGKKTVEVEIQFSPRFTSGKNYIEIYGDYIFSSDPLLFEGPTFSQSPGKLSILKYLIYDDFRLWHEINLNALVESRYSGEGELRENDLSTQPGIQSGRYRIFLLLSKKAAVSKDFPVAVKGEDYITRKKRLAKHCLQIWEVNPWKRKSNQMCLEVAHAAPGEKGGFWLVTYADTDGDGKPDRLIEKSPYFKAKKAGEWSSWEFKTKEKRIFVGMSWPKGSETTIYYERALWPDEIFPEVMYYTLGFRAATAYPVLTNMRITFLEEKPEQN